MHLSANKSTLYFKKRLSTQSNSRYHKTPKATNGHHLIRVVADMGALADSRIMVDEKLGQSSRGFQEFLDWNC